VIELQALVDFFQYYGYAAVFGMLLLCGFGLPVPEDISLVSGGIISGLGYANVHVMVAVSLAGVLIGDSVMYNLGRLFGERVLNHRLIIRFLTPDRYEYVMRRLENHGKWVLFAARFMPGLRAPIFVTTGITRFVSYPWFILIDGIAAMISVPLWVYMGFYGANNREWLMRWISRSQYGIWVVVALAALIVVIVMLLKKRMQEKEMRFAAELHRIGEDAGACERQ